MKKNWMLLIALVLVLVGVILHFLVGDMFHYSQSAALGFFAAGNFSAGIFSAGIFSVGIFSIGIFSIGVFSISIFNIGIYATGIFLLARKKNTLKLEKE